MPKAISASLLIPYPQLQRILSLPNENDDKHGLHADATTRRLCRIALSPIRICSDPLYIRRYMRIDIHRHSDVKAFLPDYGLARSRETSGAGHATLRSPSQHLLFDVK